MNLSPIRSFLLLILASFCKSEILTNITLSADGSSKYVYYSLATFGTTCSKAESFCIEKLGSLAELKDVAAIEQFSQSLSSSEVTLPVWVNYQSNRCALLYPDNCSGSISSINTSNLLVIPNDRHNSFNVNRAFICKVPSSS